MHYIVFDLEFNQDLHSLSIPIELIKHCPYEIIQIGAVKINVDLNLVASFNRYIKPMIYMQVNSFVTELTEINTHQLISEKPFSEVFNSFIEFIDDGDAVFCTWGISDMKELYRNVEYHNLDKKRLPERFINLQPYVTAHLDIPGKKLLSLQAAVEAFEIKAQYKFHNAHHDAIYTAEIFKKIYSPAIQTKRYTPDFIPARPRQQKKIIDFEKLLQQFEKMYARTLSEEEQDMIKLAYKMGRTNQFIK